VKKYLAQVTVAAAILCFMQCGHSRAQAMTHEEEALINAAADGDIAIVKKLVGQKVNIEARNSQGMSPLYVAASLNNLEVVKYLLDNGSRINAQLGDGATPLLVAISEGHSGIAKYLVERGADINLSFPNGESPLHMVSRKGNLELAELFIDKGAKIDAQVKSGLTPLSFAVQENQAKIAACLLEHGADPNPVNKGDGSSALHVAAYDKNLQLIKLLVEHKADVNLKNLKVFTPLHFAVSNGDIDTIKYLVEHGADVNAVTSLGGTALYIAAGKGNLDVVKYLVEHGADVTKADAEGNTSLEVAEHFKQPAVVEYLSSVLKGSSKKSFYFPECGVVAPAPDGWYPYNESQQDVGIIYVTKEKMENRSSTFNTGVTFYANYERIVKRTFKDTKEFIDAAFPILLSTYKDIKDKKVYEVNTNLGLFQVQEVTALFDDGLTTIAFGFLKNERGAFLFIIESPANEWQASKEIMLGVVKNLTFTAQAPSDAKEVASVYSSR